MNTQDRDVMRAADTAIEPRADQIMPSAHGIALQQHQLIAGLLPAPHSAITYYPGRKGLAERAVTGIAQGVLDYKAVLITPMIAPLVEGVACALHYAPHSALVGGAMVGVGSLGGFFSGIAALAHIANPPSPHHVGTHAAGHAGKIIATAFGVFLAAIADGVTTWLGPFAGGSWAAGMTAVAGAVVAHGLSIREHNSHKHIRDTDRIRAVAELAAATSQPTAMWAPPPTPANHHPLSQQVLYAMALAGYPGGSIDAMPVVVSPDKWSVTVNLPDGIGRAKVLAKRDDMASTLKVVGGGLTLAPGAGEHQIVFNVNNTPLAQLPAPAAHPMVGIESGEAVSIWDPVSIGIDDDALPVRVQLAGRPGIFIAGSPGSGKSNATAEVVCTVVRAVDCDLWTIDGSGRELVIFDAVAAAHSRFSMDDALDMLAALQEEINRRGDLLAEYRATELTRELAHQQNLNCIAYVIGELAYYTADDSEPKKTKEFNSRLRDIVSRGRACGVFGIFDTQKPEDRTVPSAIRDMVPLKLALKCETEEQVVTILGRGMQKSCPAHLLPVDEEGKSLGFGYLKGVPGRAPFRLRTHLITPEERYAIVDAHAPVAADAPPDGPGGGIDDENEEPRVIPYLGTHLGVVRSPRYPDGKRVDDNYVALWNALDNFVDGFTYNDVGELGILGGRSGIQRPMDTWRSRGFLVKVGTRPGSIGPVAVVWRKATADEFEKEEMAG